MISPSQRAALWLEVNDGEGEEVSILGDICTQPMNNYHINHAEAWLTMSRLSSLTIIDQSGT